MGIGPCQCLSKKEDTNNLQVDSIEKEVKEKSNNNYTLEQKANITENMPKIIKLQACCRGYIIRKRMSQQYPNLFRNPQEFYSSKPVRKKIDAVPYYSNPETRATEQRIGPFNYNMEKK